MWSKKFSSGSAAAPEDTAMTDADDTQAYWIGGGGGSGGMTALLPPGRLASVRVTVGGEDVGRRGPAPAGTRRGRRPLRRRGRQQGRRGCRGGRG